MNKRIFQTLKALQIVESCSNCDSAWTGGCANPEDLTHCIICSNRKGEITGWVWGRLIDPFYWISRTIVNRNIKRYHKTPWLK